MRIIFHKYGNCRCLNLDGTIISTIQESLSELLKSKLDSKEVEKFKSEMNTLIKNSITLKMKGICITVEQLLK